ncbi:MAG: transporter [Ferruginibacter sp.]
MQIKKYMISLVILLTPFVAAACDICGCGVGNSYIGILPEFHKHIVGFRYRYNAVMTHVGAGGEYTYLTTGETYKTIEAWTGFNIGDKFRLMAFVPLNFSERNNYGVIHSKNGIGDIGVAGYYQLLNSKRPVLKNKLLVQSLWIGAGVKMATGQYNPLDKTSNNDNANLFQLGTGSNDFNINAMYDIRLQDAGLNISSGYKINTSNRYGYRYGNKFNLSGQAYYKFRIKNKLTVAPNAGMQYEQAATDSDKDFAVTVSGGNLLLGTAGLEALVGKIAAGANYQTPISQQLANGIVRSGNRFMLHMAIAF